MIAKATYKLIRTKIQKKIRKRDRETDRERVRGNHLSTYKWIKF